MADATPTPPLESPHRWRPRIRTLLLILVVASALPIAVLVIVLADHALKAASDRARTSTLSTARLVAAGIEQEHERTRRVLERLASLPEFKALDAPACLRRFREYAPLHPELANLALVDARGHVVVSLVTPAKGASLDASSLEAFKGMLAGENFNVTGPELDPITGRWTILLGQAVRDEHGRLLGAIGTPLDAERGMGIFGRFRPPSGGILGVVARDGRVVARSRDAARWVGKSARGTRIADIALASREGTAEVDDVDGVRRLYGFVEMPETGWRVYVGNPVPARALDDFAARAGVGALIALLLAAAAAVLFSRNITPPMAALARAATAVSGGGLDAHLPVEGPEERATVAPEFNRMVEARSRSEREREGLLESERLARSRAEIAEHEFRAMLDRVEDGYVSLDSEWKYTHVNRRAGEMLNRRPADLIGKHIWTEFPEGEDHLFQHAYEQAFRDRKARTLEAHFAPWDRWFENRIHPHPAGIDIFFTEITERKRAELARDEAEARLRLAVQAASVGLWDWDLRTGDVRFSPEWKAQIGFGPTELADRFEEWESRVHPADLTSIMAKVRGYVDNPVGRYEAEFRLRHRDGTWRWILTQGNIVRDSDGKPIRFLGSHIDMTERRRSEDDRSQLEARIRRQEMLATLGALVGGVAHEVRTPLFGITATLDAMEARLGPRPESARYVATLRSEADRLNRLMQDLLDYGKPTRFERDHVSLRRAVEEALASTAREAAPKPSVEVRIADDLPDLPGDFEALVRALRNVIQNAIQHTPADGTVFVEAAMERDDGGSWLVCTVRDTGPGFREADLPRVTDPFYSRRKGGTGLGLSIAKRVVEDHGGEFVARNGPHGGAVIRFRLPARPGGAS